VLANAMIRDMLPYNHPQTPFAKNA
jgi:hypothetical protein